jgi:hypothetical protein
MARPTQFGRSDPIVAKESVKRLAPEDARARLLAWLLLYFNDEGMTYSPQISRRQRITLDSVEYWLVHVPKRTS